MKKAKHPLTINVGPLRGKKGNETLYVYNADDNTWSMVKCATVKVVKETVVDNVQHTATQSALIKALGVKLPEAQEAAFNAADGNDGTNWGLLDELCPAGMTVGEFIDLLCDPHH